MSPEQFQQDAIERELRRRARYAEKHPRMAARLDEHKTKLVRRSQALETDRLWRMVPESVYAAAILEMALEDRLRTMGAE